jgi:hypothetical protein
MRTLAIFLIVWAAMVANGFWEAYVEGRNAWDKGKLGWKLRAGRYTLSAYHFWLFWVMHPLLIIALPLAAAGWDRTLLCVLLSAYFSGLVIEDFTWFVVNPVVKMREFGPEFASWYPWIIIGKLRVPLLYVAGIGLAIVSWLAR